MEKYSIVIPTRNSIETLRHTLQTCLRQNYLNYEIIVSDNCSDDGTAEMIRSLNDKRIRYIKTPGPYSMTQNFEFALSHATEGFVMCIGADDGLMPNAIDYVDSIIRQHNVKAVSCQYAHYFWPNVPVEEKGKLTLNAMGVYKSQVEIRNASHWLAKTLRFETDLYVCDLPNLYYGFVHRSIIDKCVKDAVYFRSITPDAYSAFATAISVNNYAYSYRPFCIAGISGKSNGLSQMLNGEVAKQFIVQNTHPIHKDFVFSPAFEVIMGEAFAHLQDAFPRETAGYKVNYATMLKRAVQHSNPKTYEEVLVAARKMAQLHNIDFETIKDSFLKKSGRFFARTYKMGKKIISKGNWLTGVTDSTRFSIENVDDAATLLAVLAAANEGNKFETMNSIFWGRVKKRIFGTR